MVHGKFFGSVKRVAPVEARSCGTFFVVEIFLNRGVGGRADDLKGGENFIAFHQLADLLHGLRRAVGIVVLNKIDLAAVDATLLVDHANIGGLHLANAAVGGSRPAQRYGLTDLDLGVAGAGVVFLLRKRRRAKVAPITKITPIIHFDRAMLSLQTAAAVLRRTVFVSLYQKKLR